MLEKGEICLNRVYWQGYSKPVGHLGILSLVKYNHSSEHLSIQVQVFHAIVGGIRSLENIPHSFLLQNKMWNPCSGSDSAVKFVGVHMGTELGHGTRAVSGRQNESREGPPRRQPVRHAAPIEVFQGDEVQFVVCVFAAAPSVSMESRQTPVSLVTLTLSTWWTCPVSKSDTFTV